MLKPSTKGLAVIQNSPRPLTMRIRLSKREQAAINAAADLAGITASSWSRMILRQAAASSLHAAGRVTDL